MSGQKKKLDTDNFIALIKSKLDNAEVTKPNGNQFFGKVTFCIKAGIISHIEINEVIK